MRKSTLFLLCCFSLVWGQHQQTTCEDRWRAFQGSCYLFGGENLVFDVAEQFCRKHNAHLVHVNDAVENRFLRTWLVKTADWWIGLKVIEGIFKWTDTHESATYTDWYPGEPSAEGDCVHLYSGANDHWNDVSCTYVSRALCEKRMDDGNGQPVG